MSIEAIKSAESAPVLAVDVAAGMPAVVSPPVIPGTEPQRAPGENAKPTTFAENVKCLTLLRSALKTALAAETTVREDVFHAAAECETAGEFAGQVGKFRSEARSAEGGLPSSLDQTLSTVLKAWEQCKARREGVLKDVSDLAKLGHDVDPFLGLKMRAESGTLLDPTAAEYPEASAYFRDVNKVAALAKAAVAARKHAAKAKSLESKAAAHKDAAAGKDGNTVMSSGETKQTGNLSETVQAALNAVIRAVHGNAAQYEQAVIDALIACEHAISVDIPAEAKERAKNEKPDESARKRAKGK